MMRKKGEGRRKRFERRRRRRTSSTRCQWRGHFTCMTIGFRGMGGAGTVENLSDGVDCVLNCDSKSVSFCSPTADSYLHLPIVTSKLDRFSLMNNLSSAIDFAKLHLSNQRKLLICCQDGEDISVCVCLAIITILFDE